MYLVTAPPSSATDENQPPKAEVWVRSGIYLYVKIPPKSRCIQIFSLKFFQDFFPVRCLARQRHWFNLWQRKLQRYSRVGQSFKIQYSCGTHEIYVHSYELRSSLCVCGKLVPGPVRISKSEDAQISYRKRPSVCI